jgi:Late embryogenesis abundant protein
MLFAMRPKVNRYISLGHPLLPLILALSPFWFTACSLHPAPGIKSCRYRILSFAFAGLDAQQSHWRVDVGVGNPNDHEVTLARLHYALLYQGDTLLTGWNPEAKTVAAKDSLLATTSLDLPHAVFKRLPSAIWSQTDARFVIVADAYLHTWLGDLTVPMAVKDTVHINMPEQVAKYRDMLLQRFFQWPGKHLEDGGVPAPDESPPISKPMEPAPGDPVDEHL